MGQGPGSLPVSPALRRKRKEQGCMLKLERVLGLTSNKPMVLSVNPAYGLAAYAAGCVVVLYNYRLDKQIGLLCSSSIKRDASDGGTAGTHPPSGMSGTFGATGTLSAQAATASGQNHWNHRSNTNSAGAGVGVSPRAAASTQWLNSGLASMTNPLAGLMPVATGDPTTMSSFGSSNPNSNKNVKPKAISCLAFSPDGQFLAIGEMGHQPRILIWEVNSQTLVGELQGHKFGVQAVQFSPSSKHVVSLGFQHDGYIHVWNWKANLQIASNKVTTKVNAVAFSSDGSYFVTAGLRHIKFWYLNVASTGRSGIPNVRVLDGRSGILGELRDSNYVDAACSLDGKFTYAITSQGILCQFSEGRVMEKWIDLHVRGAYSLSLAESHIVCACADGIIRMFEAETLQYIGTLPNLNPVGCYGNPLWQTDADENSDDNVLADVLATQFDPTSGYLTCIYSDRSLVVWDISHPENPNLYRSHMFHSDCVWGVEMYPHSRQDGYDALFPPNTFLTYSADGSIKFWNLDENISMLAPLTNSSPNHQGHGPTLPSREISRVLYVDGKCKSWIQKPDIQDGLDPGFNVVPTECGIRTIKISPDGIYLASGDKGGNLRVHDLRTRTQVTYQEAHDTEIMAIDFTDPVDSDSPLLVATAGRDRLLHVFDVHNNYSLLQTLDDHSSSITCIKFTPDGSRMMSCGADKSIIFRNLHKSEEGMIYQPYHQAPGRATFYDMELHAQSQTVSAVSGDRRFSIFNLETGKPIKTIKAETKSDDLASGMAEICSMTHISLDPTGTIAAAAGSDKSVRLYDLIQGTCLAHMICHSELVTSVRFTSTCERIISTSADGCVLVWRLSPEVVRKIQTRIHENATLPARLQANVVDSAPSSAPGSVVTSPMVNPLKPKPSTDRLRVYSNDQSRTSRRNSTTSIASDDFDRRSEDTSDDWSDRTNRTEAKMEDLTKLNFTPVSTAKTRVHLQAHSAGRPRAHSSYTRAPTNRSRQNSVTQPTPLRPSTSSKLAPQQDPPQWNRNTLKERVNLTSTLSARLHHRPPSPRLTIPKSVIRNPTARPRANSMSVAGDRPLLSQESKNGTLSKEPSLPKTGPLTTSDPRNSYTPGGDESDELSDETELGFDDGISIPPLSAKKQQGGLQKKSETPSSPFASNLDQLGDGLGDDRRVMRSVSADNLCPSSPVNRRTSTLQPKSEPALADRSVSGDDTAADDASDDRDGGDENTNMDDDESDSLSDSDGDMNKSPSGHREKGIKGRSVDEQALSFHDGEYVVRSPKATSPSRGSSNASRVTSLRDCNILEGRRSLSAKFLNAHAESILQTLLPEGPQDATADQLHVTSSSPGLKQKNETEESIGGPPQDVIEGSISVPRQDAIESSTGLANKENFGSDRDDYDATINVPNCSKATREDFPEASDGVLSAPTEVSLSPRNSRVPSSLEEQLNPTLLNKAAIKRNHQRSLGSGSRVLVQLQGPSQFKGSFESHTAPWDSDTANKLDVGAQPLFSNNGSHDVPMKASTEPLTMNVALTRDSGAENSSGRAGNGILASPVLVKSPSSVHSSKHLFDRESEVLKEESGSMTRESQPSRKLELNTASGHVTNGTSGSEGADGIGGSCGASLPSNRPPSMSITGYTRRVSKRMSLTSSYNPHASISGGGVAQRAAAAIGGDESSTRSHESLQDAFDRISFLITHKGTMASMITTDEDGKKGKKSQEELQRTQQWMKETRQGLLDLVGETQGHLWMLDRMLQEQTQPKKSAAAVRRTGRRRPRGRKVQCRGLIPKNKNIDANTLTVLQAIQTRLPFVPFGQKGAAWNDVADLARANPDLEHVTGVLCESRYKVVRDEYKARRYAARRTATGAAEEPLSEADDILRDLIRLEDEAERRHRQAERAERRQQQADPAAVRNMQQAIALDIRDAALEQMEDMDEEPQSPNAAVSEDEVDTPELTPPPKRRKRHADIDMHNMKKTHRLIQRALDKYLNKQQQ
ncbi:mitogen-activated protein kinase binding protein 1 [Podila humilis]|nr:mitogen-activated protein kinase binding protein 1 [Podila humilis]